jgi:hypothetical protein
MPDIATLRTRLAAAENAYDALMRGAGVQSFVDQNQESVRYTVADTGKLAAYIASLKSQIQQACGNHRHACGPMEMWF